MKKIILLGWMAVADPGFSRGGGVNPPGGAWTRQIFPKTAWNRKNLDARGGRASLTPPLDPPMDGACYYRPQRSCEGYVFTPVCLSTGGGSASVNAGIPPPPPGAGPPGNRHPSGSKHPPHREQAPPRSRHPLEQTPPSSRPPAPSRRLLLRTVRILLEYILVNYVYSRWDLTHERWQWATKVKFFTLLIFLCHQYDVKLKFNEELANSKFDLLLHFFSSLEKKINRQRYCRNHIA